MGKISKRKAHLRRISSLKSLKSKLQKEKDIREKSTIMSVELKDETLSCVSTNIIEQPANFFDSSNVVEELPIHDVSNFSDTEDTEEKTKVDTTSRRKMRCASDDINLDFEILKEVQSGWRSALTEIASLKKKVQTLQKQKVTLNKKVKTLEKWRLSKLVMNNTI